MEWELLACGRRKVLLHFTAEDAPFQQKMPHIPAEDITHFTAEDVTYFRPRRCVILYLRYTRHHLRYLEFCIVALAILRRVTRCVTWIWAMCLSSLPGRRLGSIQGTVLELQRDRGSRIQAKRWQRVWSNLRPLRGMGLCEVSNVLCSALLMSC